MTATKFIQYMVSMLILVIGGYVAGSSNIWIGILLMGGGVWLIGLLSIDAIWDRWSKVLDSRMLLVDSRTKFVHAVSAADPETRQMTREEFPEIGVEFGVIPVFYILDDARNTGIILPFFQRFLQDSTENEFVDMRNYNDDKYLQTRFGVSRDAVRTQWRLATEHLLRKGFLLRNSMVGSHSYRWTSKAHFKKMISYYLTTAATPEIGDAAEMA